MSEIISAALNDGGNNVSLQDNYIMVAGIDFGTTFSAYAFSLRTSQNEIRMNRNWGASIGCESFKTPTSILTKPNGEFQSFGYDAENEFSQLVSDEAMPNGYNIYRHFKMLLHKEGVKMSSKVKSTSGHERPAMDIFVMALKFLKDHMLDAMHRSLSSSPDISLIRWVLTVPAIWTDESKRFMREAAYRAGLTSELESKKLAIALEPEAASAFCRLLDNDQFIHGPNEMDIINFFKPGQKFLVIDAGGGTVDITAQEILEQGKVKELVLPSGGPWGGVKIDENFVGLIENIFSEDFIKKFKSEHSNDWLSLMLCFEKTKKCVDSVTLKNIRIPLSWSIGSACSKYLGMGIDTIIKRKSHLGVTFDNGSIIISESKTKELFSHVIENITTHVKNKLQDKKLQGLEYILLVGGFGECKFLQDACVNAFSHKTKVLIPLSAQLAIIKGAVLSGYASGNVSSRISKCTYGCASMPYFDARKHKPEKKVLIDGKKLCKDIFHVFVRKGECIEMGRPKTFGFRPPEKKATWADFQLYRTDNEDVLYIDDPGVHKMGKITLRSTENYLGNYLEIRITFGDTELLVEARDKSKGGKYVVSTTIDFQTE